METVLQAQDVMDSFPAFAGKVEKTFHFTEDKLSVLQVNVGKRCNLSCKHCHVEAGPSRDEIMSKETMDACLEVACIYGFETLDITGGAPEMNPHFTRFITEAAQLGIDTIVRSNLVILDVPEYAHIPELYAGLGIQVVASLPHYTQKNSERQRGAGTFDTSLRMLRKLNALGYAQEGGPELNLVFNPGGAFLPPSQAALEKEYHERLFDLYGITFNNLFAITNNPVGRFGAFLQRSGNLEGYMRRLTNSFNASTVENMMCRRQLSVGWDGRLYDCDFNQAVALSCLNGLSIFDYANDSSLILRREIAYGNHCYACTAGSGSSCGGSTA